MGLFRRARGKCSVCGKAHWVDVGDKRVSTWQGKCSCGCALAFGVESAWWVLYYHHGRKYKERVGPSHRDALAVLGKRKAEIREGRFFQMRKRCKVHFSEFKAPYLAWAKQHKRSWERDERSLKLLGAFFGSTNLERLTLEQVERYVSMRLAGELNPGDRTPGPATVNRELACLRKLLNLAVEHGVLAENHLSGKIKLLTEPEGRTRYLSAEEIQKLLDKCNPRMRQLAHLAFLTGMRWSEIAGLRWDEVNLKIGVIRLSGGRTKNGRNRVIPLSKAARALLAAAEKACLEGCPLVFHRPGGVPVSRSRRAFKSACRRAGVKDFRFHDTRHAFASALAMRGVPLDQIAELLGHRTLTMTQRYRHLSPQALQGAVEQASSYVRGEAIPGVTRMPTYCSGKCVVWLEY